MIAFYVVLIVTFVSTATGHVTINKEEHAATSWDVCARWRGEIDRSIRGGVFDRPDVAVITGCEWRQR